MHDLPELLHDATLVRGVWNREARQLALTFECLRSGTDGLPLLDRKVELRLDGVRAIAISYDTFWPYQRPSELRIPKKLAITSIDRWPLQRGEVQVALDDADRARSTRLAARTDWLLGDASASATGHTLTLEPSALDEVRRWITIVFDEMSPWSGGKPFAPETWRAEHAAWWKRWRESDDDDLGLIPAGEDAPVEPTGEPVFELEPTDAPEPLVAAVRTWFETQDPDQGAAGAHGRAITSWWQEGGRAHVRVEGVLHMPADEEDPAQNHLTHWDFGLADDGGHWRVVGSAEGLVRDRAEPPAWAARWKAGTIERS